jgi:alkyl hydroperoxide reductase subunit AhpC
MAMVPGGPVPQSKREQEMRDAAKVTNELPRDLDPELWVVPPQIGDEVPNFTCDSTVGTFTYHDVIDGDFSVLVTMPRDFDPVGTTELGMLAKLKEEFEGRHIKLYCLSCDTKMNHRRWIEETNELEECKVGFPLIADETGEISRVLGLVRPGAVNAMRALSPASCIIVADIDKRIKMVSYYPTSVGRNFYELLRYVERAPLLPLLLLVLLLPLGRAIHDCASTETTTPARLLVLLLLLLHGHSYYYYYYCYYY